MIMRTITGYIFLSIHLLFISALTYSSHAHPLSVRSSADSYSSYPEEHYESKLTCSQQCVTTPSGCKICYKKCSQEATFSSCKSNPCERETFATQQQRILCLIRQPQSEYDDQTECMLTCCGVNGFSYQDLDQCSETYNNTQFILKILALMLPLVIVVVPLCVCWIAMEFKSDDQDLNSDDNSTIDREYKRNQYLTDHGQQAS